ncbi:MAG TPA: hypothetical protein DCF84_06665 [Bacteroidetes bacterium]|nr:hypothetical protein [Bacteroidota bacterium]|tara:strand:+ start:719 stop:1237 length:519 start_codon:yes stop_codon:yes gene_type:complete
MGVLVDSPTSKGLLTIDLVKILPKSRVEILDVQHFMGGAPLLKETAFRKALQDIDFDLFKNTIVGFSNQEKHILPQWASILLAVKFEQNNVWTTWADSKETLYNQWLLEHVEEWDTSLYVNARVSIKGCTELTLSARVYMAYARKLLQVSKVVSFGEKCALVPISKDVSLKS